MKLRDLLHPNQSKTTKDIVVFGAGRSGTTWLAQIIASAGLEFIFEPLNPGEVAEARVMKPLPLFCRKRDAFEWQDLFTKMMNGEIRNSWTLRANPGAERKVIKFIRANLLIEWILHNYDVHPVFIVRNPLSVVASIIEQGWELKADWVRQVLSSPRLNEPFFARIPEVSEWVSRDLTDAEIKALYWCIHNHVPKSTGLYRRLHLVRYEELCQEPEEVFGRLALKIGIPLNSSTRSAFAKPSFMRGKRQGTKGYDPRKAWRDILTPEDVAAIKNIVVAFDLAEYFDDA